MKVSDGQVGSGQEEDASSVLARFGIAIDHIAIAVRDLDQAIEMFCERFGFGLSERRRIDGGHSGMESAVLEAGPIKFVLVQGTSPESNVCKYIAEYGPGVQHVALRVGDARGALRDLDRRGCDVLTGLVRNAGLDQVFTRRDPNSGMQVEIISRSANDGFSATNMAELFEAMEREDVY